jgi:hypothetical protein
MQLVGGQQILGFGELYDLHIINSSMHHLFIRWALLGLGF